MSNGYFKKTYYYKVYSYQQNNSLVKIWRNEILTEPNFRTVINGGGGEMTLRLARPFDDFGENIDIDLYNRVDCYCVDREAPNGVLLFSGYIISYAPVLENDNQYLMVKVRAYANTLVNRILKDSSGNTKIDYFSKDPSFIFKDIIDKFKQYDSGQINYTALSVANTNTVVSYSFNTVTYKEALDKVIELAPEGWFYRIDPDGIAYFNEKINQVTHQISTKKDIEFFSPEKNLDDFINEVYFVGAENNNVNIYYRKQQDDSINKYGKFAKQVVDGRVTDQDTVEIIINRILNEKSIPTRRTTVKVLDSNGDTRAGYDIESIKVGDTIEISELTGAVPNPTLWDKSQFDDSNWDNLRQNDPRDIMQITSLTYSPDYVEIEATTRLPEISKRIEDIKRNQELMFFRRNPVKPTEA